uniref:Uncharacterized protein n=1 Tax=Arundo donax TaxID=35708 RepID=A0A0A9BWE9_ARUDO
MLYRVLEKLVSVNIFQFRFAVSIN